MYTANPRKGISHLRDSVKLLNISVSHFFVFFSVEKALRQHTIQIKENTKNTKQKNKKDKPVMQNKHKQNKNKQNKTNKKNKNKNKKSQTMLSMIEETGGKRCSHRAAFPLHRDTEHLWKRWRVVVEGQMPSL